MYCDLKINEILKRYDKKLIEAINLNKSQLSLLIETFNIFTMFLKCSKRIPSHLHMVYFTLAVPVYFSVIYLKHNCFLLNRKGFLNNWEKNSSSITFY